jgi:tetratricopeptide (TPR) repeat protein
MIPAMPNWETVVAEMIARASFLDDNNQWQQAIETYEQAYQMIPEPKEESELAMVVLFNIGELHYLEEEWQLAFEDFCEAVKCKEGLGNPQIHLRLGQLRYRRGEMDRATDEFMRAYMAAGELAFEGEDPKYFELIQSYVR